MADVQASTGLTLIFLTSNFTANFRSVKWNGIKRGTTSVTKMGDTHASFLPQDMSDGGELEGEISFNPDHIAPIQNAAESVLLIFPNGSYWQGSMFITEFEPTAELEQQLLADFKAKVTGTVTTSAGISILTPVINDDSVFVNNDDGTLVYGA